MGLVGLTWWDPSDSVVWMGFRSSPQFQVKWEPWWSLPQQNPLGSVWSLNAQSQGCSVGSAGEEAAVRALLAGRLCPGRLP